MLNFKKNKVFTGLFLIILLWGAILRLWHLGYSSYWLDEGFSLMQGEGIIKHGYPLLSTGWIEWKDMLIPYLIAPLIKIFGLQASFFLRLPSALFGIATIIIGYTLANKLFSRLTALMFSIFLSFGYWYIAWSQQIRGYSALVFFVLLFFYFLTKHLQTKQTKYLWFAGLAIIFATLSKTFGILLIGPLLFYLFSKKEFKFILLIVMAIGLASPLLINKMSNVIHFNNSHFGFYLQKYLWHYFSIVLVPGWFGIIAGLLNDQKNKIIHFSILVFILEVLTILSVAIIITEGRYLLMVTPFLFLYTAYLIEYLTKNFKHKIIISSALFIIIFISSAIYDKNIVIIPQDKYLLEKGTPQPNYKKAYSKIKQNGFKENDIVISSNPTMDLIYLGKVNYTIRWSLTGREGDDMFENGKDVYTGALKLYGRDGYGGMEKIKKLQHKNNVYVIIDSLALRRMNPKLREGLLASDKTTLLEEKGNGNGIAVFFFNGTVSNHRF